MDKKKFRFTAAYNSRKTIDQYAIFFAPYHDYWTIGLNASTPQDACQYGGRFYHLGTKGMHKFFMDNKEMQWRELPETVQHQTKKIEERLNYEKHENRIRGS